MPQFSFMLEKGLSSDEIDQIKKSLANILQKLVEKISNKAGRDKLIKVLLKENVNFSSTETNMQKPEEFTKEYLILPILTEILGYKKELIDHESYLSGPSRERGRTRKYPDYRINLEEGILVEAEHIGTDLKSKGKGDNQVYDWLELISTKENIGISTNGVIWNLFRRDKSDNIIIRLISIDMREILYDIGKRVLKIHNSSLTKVPYDEILSSFISFFHKDNIVNKTNEVYLKISGVKEEVTKKFYEEFIALIFGKSFRNNGSIDIKTGDYLLAQIDAPKDATESDKKMFALTFMNRLIFIRFLENKRIIEDNFIHKQWIKYKESNQRLGFYKHILTGLFYDVLNKPQQYRKSTDFNSIPYLNGGLFRENLKNESYYDISDNIIDEIIKFLDSYIFTINKSSPTANGNSLNPDILGKIYEKIINIITEGGQKAKGAYYTPENITFFISRRVIYPQAVKKLKEVLLKKGWKPEELSDSNDISDLINYNKPITEHSNVIDAMRESLFDIHIVDPACGSGHFLVSCMDVLFSLHKELLKIQGKEIDDFRIKCEIIEKNLYGVDVDSNAVEIAKLRLWLSLIDLLNMSSSNQIDTLPNIEYNIITGNSLIGIVKPIEIRKIDIENSSENIVALEELEHLKREYRESKESSDSESLRDNIKKKTDNLLEKINKYYVSILKDTIPLHWGFMFYEIMNSGGFDIVIGNPPYGDIINNEEKNLIGAYSTWNKEIASVFVERSIDLCREDGTLGFIMTFAITFHEGLSQTRNKLITSYKETRISTFDRDICRVFSNMTQSVSILLCEGRLKQNDENKKRGLMITSEFMRTMPNDLNTIPMEPIDGLILGEGRFINNLKEKHRIPKIGSSESKIILQKLGCIEKKISNIKSTSNNQSRVFIRTSGNYWYNAWNWKPYDSREIKEIHIKNEYVNIFLLLMNSSLFYWYMRVYGDGRHMNISIMDTFPVPDEDTINRFKREINDMTSNIMQSLKDNFDENRKRFLTSKCKNVIDQCDDLLGKIYGLTNDEIEYIKNYDSIIRNSKMEENETED